MLGDETTLRYLVRRIDRKEVQAAGVLPWSCPVPVFGDLRNSCLATVGINPSNLEFTDRAGKELIGLGRRFPTLNALQLESWAAIKAPELKALAFSYKNYFSAQPYRRWFDVLDDVIEGTGVGFYGSGARACHLDLVPYATATKWGQLKAIHKRELLGGTRDLMGDLVRSSPLKVLVLNGTTVVKAFAAMTAIGFTVTRQPAWDLPRARTAPVRGFSFQGSIDQIGSVKLLRSITVIGFNHNLQSSHGITTGVKHASKSWITENVGEINR